MATTSKKKTKETDTYMEKDRVEAEKPVWLEELGGSCTSGEEESGMEEFC